MCPVVQLRRQREIHYQRMHRTSVGLTPPEVGAADASSAMDKAMSVRKVQATNHCQLYANKIINENQSQTGFIALTPQTIAEGPPFGSE